MSVYQVEQYYLYMSKLTMSEDQRDKIKEYLDGEGYGCNFEENNTALTVDEIESESEGYDLEEQINLILEESE